MKYRLLRFSLLSMLVMLFGGSILASEVTFSMATKWTANTKTEGKSGITVSFSDGCTQQTGYSKFPKSNTCTISIIDGNITGVSITYTGEDYSTSTKSGECLSTDVGTLNAKATSTTSTWEGEAKTIVFTNASNGWDLRVSEINITYTTESPINAYKTLTFPDDNKDNNKVGNYTSTWTATIGSDSWSIANFNNNNWSSNWSYIKCGSKNAASVGTITTSSAIDKTINRVVVTVDAATIDKINSTKLEVASDQDFTSNVQTINGTMATGDIIYEIPNPTTSQYYRLSYDCQQGSGNGLVTISKVVYYTKESTASEKTATSIALAKGYATTGAVGTTLALPTATVMAGDTNLNASVTWSSENETVATIENGEIILNAAGTAKIKASYAGDETYEASSASYTLTVYAAAYTSLTALQEAATATSTPVQITFNNVYVTGVKSKNAYLADADGYGALIYTDGHGLTAGKVLNGTTIANLVLYNGYAEITGFSTTGLEITEGEYTPIVKTIDALTTANQCAVVTLKNVTYDATNSTFSDGTNTIKYYDNFGASPTLVDGTAYDVTGVVVLYKSNNEIVLEICPRTANDIVAATPAEPAGWRDIKIDLTNKNLLTEGEIAGIQNETNKTPSMNIGVAVASDGTISRVDKDADNAAAVLTGKWHSNEHGWSNFSATVPVEGTVKITFGTCAWGGDVTVKNADDATVATFNTNTGACYHNDKENNIISAYYKQDVATTLTISGGSYVPYFAVEKVDPKDVPSDVKFVFDASESGAEGVAPAEATVGIGKTFTMPKNFTLYKEGYTLTAWTDGTNNYAVGEDMTAPDAETVTLTPVFTQNEVSLAGRTEPVTVKWNFRRDQGAPAVGWEGQDGLIWVAQATIGDKTIDVALPFSTAPGKFNNKSNTDWVQINNGTTFHVPSCKGATISMEAYSDITTTTIDGQSDYTQGKTISYTIAGNAESVDVVIGDGSYYRYIQAVLPVVESSSITQEKAIIDTDFQDWAKSSATSEITTNFSKENITFTYVNTSVDPTATNDGKFNSAEDPAYKGYIMSEKKEATVTTTAFKNITKVRYRHGATGSNRGWGLKMKVEDGEWETINDVTVSSPVWVEKEINKNNVRLQWYNLNTSQNAYMFELEVYSNVEINAEQVTLSTSVSPEGAGKVTVYPISETYDKGTELTLTATENFGYDFVNWTNAAGEVVSTEAKFKYTINANETLTANFKAVETYELALTVDGTNDYMVTVSPAPEVVDGKWMYEAGTTVELTANQYEGLVTFTNWSDGETNSSKLISMTEDVTLTAFYAQADIIAGWDFYKAGNNGRKADFAAQDNEADALSLVNTKTGETSGWLDKSTEAAGGYESFKGAAVNWRTGESEGDVGYWHWQTKVNAGDFENINVQFDMMYNFNAYQTYDAEYSFDGENWTKFGSITMEGAKKAVSFKETLPAECNNKAELYIRMKADKTSQVDGTASKNDGNTLAMFFITGTPNIVDDGKAPVLVSTVPANNATGVSASGKIVLTFDERVKVKADTKATLGTTELTPVVSGKVITFEYKGLQYGTAYTFTLPANTVGDLTDNMIAEPITITFTTMVRPTVEKKLYDAVVENVDQLVAALANAQNRADKNVRYRIFLKKGTYTLPRGASKHYRHTNGKSGSDEVVFHESDYPDPITYFNAQNVSIIGEDRDATIITNDIPADMTFEGAYGAASVYEGIGNSDVFQLSGNNSYWQDLTVSTGMEDNRGRDIAVEDKGTKTIWKNTKLHGYQDTWVGQNDNGLYYFEDGIIRGRTDYICGKGDAYYNHVEFLQIAGGYCAVPSKPANIGWVMKDCTINGDGSGVDGNYTLGRPWGQGTPVALWIDTKMNVVPSAIGWNEMSGGWPKRFAEYNSMTSTGSQVDLSGRKKTFGDGHANNPVLTAAEALEAGNLHNMFGEWDPTLATEQAPIVSDVKLTGNELTWTGSNYALLYAIVKNGEVIDFTKETTYNIGTAAGSRRAESTDKYQIRAANEMGGLNEASEVATATDGIETVNVNVNVNLNLNDNIYNLQGVRVNKAQKGVYIIGGRKVVVK